MLVCAVFHYVYFSHRHTTKTHTYIYTDDGLGAMMNIHKLYMCIPSHVNVYACMHVVTNTYIYTDDGLGAWRLQLEFSDFTRAGLGVKIIHTLVCVFLAAQFWSFNEKIDWKGVKV